MSNTLRDPVRAIVNISYDTKCIIKDEVRTNYTQRPSAKKAAVYWSNSRLRAFSTAHDQ